MEFEDVKEKVEWEAGRVAAAFGLKEVECEKGTKSNHYEEDITESIKLATYFNFISGMAGICIFESERVKCEVDYSDTDSEWVCVHSGCDKLSEIMARGLYLLGIEDAGVLAELNYPLTAHEKLEVRHSLPREFWPQTWLDVEGGY